MDVSKMKKVGWQYSTELEDGITKNLSMVFRKYRPRIQLKAL